MRKAVLVMATALMTLAILATPVLAIGPVKAQEVGHNPNLVGADGLAFLTNNGGNTFIWFNIPGKYQNMIYHDADASIGGGRANTAVMANLAMLSVIAGNPDYYNTWIFLSTDPSTGAGGKSVLWWFAEVAFGAGYGNILVANHPNGIYVTWHFVK